MTASEELALSHRNGPCSRVGVSTNCSWLQYRHERALSFHTALSVRSEVVKVAAGTSGMAGVAGDGRYLCTTQSTSPGWSICR